MDEESQRSCPWRATGPSSKVQLKACQDWGGAECHFRENTQGTITDTKIGGC